MSTAVITATENSLTIDLTTEGPELLAQRDSANLATPEAGQAVGVAPALGFERQTRV